jgi:hypothetical protein
MEAKRPEPTPELTTDGLLPVQFFVTRAIPLPPGTPAKPRADRPALDGSGAAPTELPEDGATAP